MQGCSASMEDFLEKIYLSVERKGVARVGDLAAQLRLRPPTVTRMVQKLGERGLVHYERYRGLTLTARGRELGRFLSERHTVLEEFLHLLGCSDPATVYAEVEGIEHHVSPATLDRIRRFVAFAREHPEWMEAPRRRGAEAPAAAESPPLQRVTGSPASIQADMPPETL